MTPEQFYNFCQQHGGQQSVSEAIGRHPRHINKLANGKQPISDKIIHLLKLTYGEIFTSL